MSPQHPSPSRERFGSVSRTQVQTRAGLAASLQDGVSFLALENVGEPWRPLQGLSWSGLVLKLASEVGGKKVRGDICPLKSCLADSAPWENRTAEAGYTWGSYFSAVPIVPSREP